MSGPVEYATGGRDGFPRSWGPAPGTPYSEERAAWVSRHTKLQQIEDLNGREARAIAEQCRRDANSAVAAAHLKVWQQILADLLEADTVDPSVVDGHLAVWAAAIAKLK